MNGWTQINPFWQYRCNSCHRRYWGADLIRTKCSENMTGNYLSDLCPYCAARGKYGRIEKYADGDS